VIATALSCGKDVILRENPCARSRTTASYPSLILFWSSFAAAPSIHAQGSHLRILRSQRCRKLCSPSLPRCRTALDDHAQRSSGVCCTILFEPPGAQPPSSWFPGSPRPSSPPVAVVLREAHLRRSPSDDQCVSSESTTAFTTEGRIALSGQTGGA